MAEKATVFPKIPLDQLQGAKTDEQDGAQC
jgi:hypothetical protein